MNLIIYFKLLRGRENWFYSNSFAILQGNVLYSTDRGHFYTCSHVLDFFGHHLSRQQPLGDKFCSKTSGLNDSDIIVIIIISGFSIISLVPICIMTYRFSHTLYVVYIWSLRTTLVPLSSC